MAAPGQRVAAVVHCMRCGALLEQATQRMTLDCPRCGWSIGHVDLIRLGIVEES